MISAAELAKERNFYLERFTRFEYPGAFERYKEACMPLFSELEERPALIGDAVGELMAYAAEQSKGLFRRSLEPDKFRRLFALYLVPAAGESGTEAAVRFADELRRAWNEKYPKQQFSAGTYAEIAGGFRTKPFGMG